MCGIAGILQNKGGNSKKSAEAIKKMNEDQKRRGPDDEGAFLELAGKNGVVALGHRRLSILDLSKKGHQPMRFIQPTTNNQQPITNNLWLTFNGEIYNFKELKKELESRGYKFKTQTDTEVILALYGEYGEKSFEMLRGMFAFGLWDGKNKKLFLVKDRYGIKPLYYYADNEKLVFASTVKALENSGIMPIQKNADAFIGFMLFGSVPLPTTTIKNVLAVPAGHYLIREIDGSQKIVKYYEPLEFFNKVSNYSANELLSQKSNSPIINSPITHIRNLLNDSVEKHLISDAPLGVFLSGGLDSSALAALAASRYADQDGSEPRSRTSSLRSRRGLTRINQQLKTLSIVFEEKEFSEEYYSDLVTEKIGSDHRKIKITKQDFYDSFDEIFETMDQPTIDGVNTFFIAKAAKQAGLKTVLSGLGADEIFMGYPFFKKAGIMASLWKSPKIFKNLAFYGLKNRFPKIEYIKNEKLNYYPAIRGIFSPGEASKILGTSQKEINDFLEEIFSKQIDESVCQLAPEDVVSYLELKFYLQNQLLKDTDFMSMRHSIEVRVPFLDHPLVEYVSGLTPETKLNIGKSDFPNIDANFRKPDFQKLNKPLLVASVYNLLPQEIFTRPKMGFTFPFEKWLMQQPTTNNQQLTTKTHWSRFWAMAVLNRYL